MGESLDHPSGCRKQSGKVDFRQHKEMLVHAIVYHPRQDQIKAAFKRLRDNPESDQRIWFTEHPSSELQPQVDKLYAFKDEMETL